MGYNALRESMTRNRGAMLAAGTPPSAEEEQQAPLGPTSVPTRGLPERRMDEIIQGTSDPESTMRMIWEQMPTDEVGEFLEMMSRRLGVPPPWAKDERGKLRPLNPNDM
jgi:hypothetical protein